MNKLNKLVISSVSAALLGTLFLGTSALAKGEKYKLDSIKVSSVSMDINDSAWDKATSLKLPLTETPYKPDGYKGMTKTDATIKSLYDDKNIYFKVEYNDPTKSVSRYPWIKQSDGSWKQMKKKDQTGHDNSYYEDKVGLYFNINARGFAKKGCAIACHITKDGMNNGLSDTSAGRKYTRKEGQTIDMWHWKSVRTGLAFDLTHDQYVDHIADPKISKNWGRHGDEKLAGGYKNNINKDKKMPMYMNKNVDNTLTYLKDSEKVPFVDTFKTGDMVPGIVVSKMAGSAADIKTTSKYANGKWTLIFKRALKTSHPKSKIQDVQFNTKKPAYFGLAVFDNSQINHIFHEGSIKLSFK